MKYKRLCPMCGEHSTIEVNDERINEQIDLYKKHLLYIQDVDLSASQREFIKTGYLRKQVK